MNEDRFMEISLYSSMDRNSHPVDLRFDNTFFLAENVSHGYAEEVVRWGQFFGDSKFDSIGQKRSSGVDVCVAVEKDVIREEYDR